MLGCWSRALTCFVMVLAICLAACGGSPYGHSRNYENYGDEGEQLKGTSDAKFGEVSAHPEEFVGTRVAWFATVDNIEKRTDGKFNVFLSYRELQPRNLCRDRTDESCRVTVSDRVFGEFVAVMELSTEELAGETGIHSASLLRVIGPVEGARGSKVVVRAQWYRHWPFHYYVTTGASQTMRR